MSLPSIFSLHLLLLLTTTVTATAASCTDKITTATAACTTEVVSFSACLPYTAMPPNNLTSSASSDCCDSFSGILASNVSCFCTLIGEPSVFGFPLNFTRILSLSSVCPLAPELKNLTIFRNYTLQSFCSEKSPLPPNAVQENQNQSDCTNFSPGSAAAPSSFHSIDSKPQTVGDLYLPPTQPGGSRSSSQHVSSATTTRKPWRWIVHL
ncbi:hypothetical protein RND81_05G149300 [Saponaria officinalis]|uniref:Bifunctional inhibitor/plant lipid transfer protein/seed storage helical domain-containing protein n=1 Tax=Saponaria officinalis TaxID=3572 RepID=A0AAW1KWV2_SAPOF